MIKFNDVSKVPSIVSDIKQQLIDNIRNQHLEMVYFQALWQRRIILNSRSLLFPCFIHSIPQIFLAFFFFGKRFIAIQEPNLLRPFLYSFNNCSCSQLAKQVLGFWPQRCRLNISRSLTLLYVIREHSEGGKPACSSACVLLPQSCFLQLPCRPHFTHLHGGMSEGTHGSHLPP